MDATTQMLLISGLEQLQNAPQARFVKEFIKTHPEDKTEIKKIVGCYQEGMGLDRCLQGVLQEEAVNLDASFFAEDGADYYVYESNLTEAELKARVLEDDSDVFTKLLLVRELLVQQKFEEAKLYLNKVQAVIGESVNVMSFKGYIAYGEGDFEKAVLLLEKVYEQTGEADIEKVLLASYDQLAAHHILKGRYDLAVHVWEKMNTLVPFDEAITMQLGTGYMLLGDKSNAMEVFKKAADDNPFNNDAYLAYQMATGMDSNLGFSVEHGLDTVPLWDVINQTQVKEVVNLQTISQQKSWQTLLAYAYTALKKGEYDIAVKALEKAKDVCPEATFNGHKASNIVKIWLAFTYLQWDHDLAEHLDFYGDNLYYNQSYVDSRLDKLNKVVSYSREVLDDEERSLLAVQNCLDEATIVMLALKSATSFHPLSSFASLSSSSQYLSTPGLFDESLSTLTGKSWLDSHMAYDVDGVPRVIIYKGDKLEVSVGSDIGESFPTADMPCNDYDPGCQKGVGIKLKWRF